MMKEIGKIRLDQMRDHMRNNFRCSYFMNGKEVFTVTSNFWAYRKDGTSFLSSADAVVTVMKEVEG